MMVDVISAFDRGVHSAHTGGNACEAVQVSGEAERREPVCGGSE